MPHGITEWVGDDALALADLGYEGEPDIFRIPFKKPADTTLTVDQQAYNTVHGALRCCLGQRANSLIKTTYKALRLLLSPDGVSASKACVEHAPLVDFAAAIACRRA